MGDSPVVGRVREIIEPIASDLQLDLYDLDMNGGILRVVLDTPPGSDGGVTLDTLALATRIISREFDHIDPIPGRYTLEVTSPGVERTLRTPAHFQREIGKVVAVRLANVDAEQRRLQGELVAADDDTATIRTDNGDQAIAIDQIDRAKTVFEWGPQPKKGGKNAKKKGAGKSGRTTNSGGKKAAKK